MKKIFKKALSSKVEIVRLGKRKLSIRSILSCTPRNWTQDLCVLAMCFVVSHTPTIQDPVLNVRVRIGLQIKGWENYTMQILIKEVKWLLKYMKLILELGTVSSGSDLTVENASLGELHSLNPYTFSNFQNMGSKTGRTKSSRRKQNCTCSKDSNTLLSLRSW